MTVSLSNNSPTPVAHAGKSLFKQDKAVWPTLFISLSFSRGKTTYYLRTMGATRVQKSTLQSSSPTAIAALEIPTAPQACAIDDPDCEACQ